MGRNAIKCIMRCTVIHDNYIKNNENLVVSWWISVNNQSTWCARPVTSMGLV